MDTEQFTTLTYFTTGNPAGLTLYLSYSIFPVHCATIHGEIIIYAKTHVVYF